MPFVKNDPTTGFKDGNVNRSGRPRAEDLVNPKSVRESEIREQEFKAILRKLKPLNKKALAKLHVILDDEKATEATKMKAIAFVLGMYKDLMNEVYLKKEDEEDKEVDKDELNPAPVFSLRMISTDVDKKD